MLRIKFHNPEEPGYDLGYTYPFTSIHTSKGRLWGVTPYGDSQLLGEYDRVRGMWEVPYWEEVEYYKDFIIQEVESK